MLVLFLLTIVLPTALALVVDRLVWGDWLWQL